MSKIFLKTFLNDSHNIFVMSNIKEDKKDKEEKITYDLLKEKILNDNKHNRNEIMTKSKKKNNKTNNKKLLII